MTNLLVFVSKVKHCKEPTFCYQGPSRVTRLKQEGRKSRASLRVAQRTLSSWELHFPGHLQTTECPQDSLPLLHDPKSPQDAIWVQVSFILDVPRVENTTLAKWANADGAFEICMYLVWFLWEY